MTYSFIHSAPSNVPLFAAAVKDTGAQPEAHHVRSDLMQKAAALGGLDDELTAEIADALRTCAMDVDLLLLTCSSLSPVADTLKAEGVKVERTDRLLAEAVFAAAMKQDAVQSVAVLVAAPTTVEPTRTLFETCRLVMGAERVGLEIIVLPDVWDLFLSGDLEGYSAAVTKAIDAFLSDSADFTQVALGQASMGPALTSCLSARASSVWTVTGATRDFLVSR